MVDLTATRNQIRARATFIVADSARQLQARLQQTSPRDTGRMQQATTVRADGLTATARAATEYASYVRDGTRPHLIRPRRARVLSFFWPVTGRQMFLPRVNHPGTKGNTWWDRAISGWADMLREALRRAP